MRLFPGLGEFGNWQSKAGIIEMFYRFAVVSNLYHTCSDICRCQNFTLEFWGIISRHKTIIHVNHTEQKKSLNQNISVRNKDLALLFHFINMMHYTLLMFVVVAYLKRIKKERKQTFRADCPVRHHAAFARKVQSSQSAVCIRLWAGMSFTHTHTYTHTHELEYTPHVCITLHWAQS